MFGAQLLRYFKTIKLLMWYVMITRVPVIRVPGIVIREFISLGRQRDRYFIDSGGKRGVGAVRREYFFWREVETIWRGLSRRYCAPPREGGCRKRPRYTGRDKSVAFIGRRQKRHGTRNRFKADVVRRGYYYHHF